MKKCLIIALSFCIMLVGCTSDNTAKNDVRRHELKGKVKSFEKTTYYLEKWENNEGEIGYDTTAVETLSLHFNKNSWLTESSVIVTTANMDGVNTRLVIKERTDTMSKGVMQVNYGDDQYLYQVSMRYDKNGNMLEQITSNDDETDRLINTFNLDGYLSSSQSYSNGQITSITKYGYDANGRKKSMSVINSYQREQGRTSFTYDANGLLSKTLSVDKNSKYDYTIEYYHYDSNGNISQIEQKNLWGVTWLVENDKLDLNESWQNIESTINNDGDGGVVTTNIYFTYDKQNNIIRREEISNGRTCTQVVCKIAYYNAKSSDGSKVKTEISNVSGNSKTEQSKETNVAFQPVSAEEVDEKDFVSVGDNVVIEDGSERSKNESIVFTNNMSDEEYCISIIRQLYTSRQFVLEGNGGMSFYETERFIEYTKCLISPLVNLGEDYRIGDGEIKISDIRLIEGHPNCYMVYYYGDSWGVTIEGNTVVMMTKEKGRWKIDNAYQDYDEDGQFNILIDYSNPPEFYYDCPICGDC